MRSEGIDRGLASENGLISFHEINYPPNLKYSARLRRRATLDLRLRLAWIGSWIGTCSAADGRRVRESFARRFDS
ncbi:hypothetical protein EVAR_90224_1 [Eumeta japonica]|uniref:Uncharacterized protein n=1 Tax=Eumeta variegata TaxID=151549 RepID=A0A4C1WX26_EUMVA|nr:hypothetical protein EVAR_90224_1 [Eumeta japonica]